MGRAEMAALVTWLCMAAVAACLLGAAYNAAAEVARAHEARRSWRACVARTGAADVDAVCGVYTDVVNGRTR